MRKRFGRVMMEGLEGRILLSSVVDLLAVYTPQSEVAAGGVAGIVAKIKANVAATNQAMVNSQLAVTIRLVGATLVNYTEAYNMSLDLDRLDNPTDGYLDNVPGLKSYFGADVVALFDSQPDAIDEGISFELDPSNPNRASDAYAVIDQSALATEYLLAHELGHIFGAAHAVTDPGGEGATPSAYGYRFRGTDGVLYHDIMAYDPGQIIPDHSNPRLTYAGARLGVVGQADASGTIATYAPSVSLYHAPPVVIGGLETATPGLISGWTEDPKAINSAVGVQVYIDGSPRGTMSANGARADLLTLLGSSAHGFSFTPPQLALGKHTVSVYGFDTVSGAAVLLGTKVLTVSPPVGWIDGASATKVAGWAVDPAQLSAAVTVSWSIDGVAAGSQPANVSRPDLVAKYGSANHGFAITLTGLSVGIHRVDVFATKISSGVKTLIGSTQVDTNTAPTGWVDSLTAGTIAGWAWSADAGAGPINVRYTIDGGPPVFVAANVNRPDLAASFGSTAHGFSIALPALTTGKHTITVSAVDSLTKAFTVIGSKVLTVTDTAGSRRPKGVIDLANNSVVSGWAYDPDAGAAAIMVRVDVDGVTGTPFLANVSRPDLVKAIGSAGHGFSFALPVMSAGAHRVDVYAYDSTTNMPVLIGSRETVTGGLQGRLDVATLSMIAGWAYAPAPGGAPAQVRIDVDGMIGSLVTANVTRPDLAFLGGTDFGFSVGTANIAKGTHHVLVWLLDPVTDNLVQLGAKNLVMA